MGRGSPARVTRRVSAFHRAPPAGSDGGAGPGRRARGLAPRDATAPAAFTALGASEAATSRRREPLPPRQERPVPVGCLPVPGKDISGLTRVWREGPPATSSQEGHLGIVGDEGPLGCPSVTRSSRGQRAEEPGVLGYSFES